MRLTAIIFDALLVLVLAALTFVLTTYGDDTPRDLFGVHASAVPSGYSEAANPPVSDH